MNEVEKSDTLVVSKTRLYSNPAEERPGKK